MKHLLTCAVLTLLPLALVAQSAAPAYAYTGAADAPVITLDYQGSRLKRLDSAPTLSIYADGRVVMPQIYAHSRAYEGRISQAELQSLLDVAIRQNDFFAYDAAVVKTKVSLQAGAALTLPEHLATTVIQINANHASKSVSYFGLGHDTLVKETEQLLAIRQRLDQVMSLVKLGGAAKAQRWLDLANADVRTQAPSAALLTLADLQSAAVHADGSVNVRFARIDLDAQSSVSATVAQDSSGARRVTVARNDLLQGKQ